MIENIFVVILCKGTKIFRMNQKENVKIFIKKQTL